jgi:predicted metal-dependent phosphotriesterase family hydrolase
VDKPDGGEFRPFDTMFTQFLPALKAASFTDEEVRQLLVVNPREAFTVRVRAIPE